MTGWIGSWTRLAGRKPMLFRASAVIVVLAVVVSGLAGARCLIGWWEGPKSIGVGIDGADALAVSPDGRTLYAANWSEQGDAGGVTVVDLATGRAGRRIDTGGPAVELTMMPGGRALYALVEPDDGSARLVRIRLTPQRAQQQFTFRNGAEGMVAAPAGSRLYVLAAASRHSAAVIPVDTESGQDDQAIPVPPGSQAMAISPDGRTLYIGAGSADGKGPGEVVPIDTRSGNAGTAVRFPHPVTGLAVSPDGHELFGLAPYQCSGSVGCGGGCELAGIDITTGAAALTARLDSGCSQIQVAPDHRRLFVLNTANSLTAVNSATGKVEKTIRTTGFLAAPGDSDFLIAPDGRTVYVADQFRGVVVIPVAH